MKRKLISWFIWILILSALLLTVGLSSLSIGTAGIYFGNIIRLIFEGGNNPEWTILFDIRLPRILLGIAIGGALSIAGVILQGMFRNPLVEPYTLGIAGGAALGVCLNILLNLHQILGIISLPISGFLGAGLVILSVYSLSVKRGILRIPTLLLIGVMISFIASSLITLIMAIAEIEDLHGIVFWIMGSLEEPNWSLIKLALIIAILGLVVSFLFSHHLNAFSLGEEEALHLGINVEKTKRLLFIIASLLTGVSVSIAGIIGFVGLIIPHTIRMIIGSDHRILLISSFLGGASFLIFCDTLSRVIISPLELPVGVITGILGGSVFVYLLSRKAY